MEWQEAWKAFADDFNLTANPDEEIADDLSPEDGLKLLGGALDAAYDQLADMEAELDDAREKHAQGEAR